MSGEGHSRMTPVQELLHRIQWDPAYGASDFVIGYLDKVAGRIVRVPFRRVAFRRGDKFALDVVEEDGSSHWVPLHRVREVWRDGVLIWQRRPA